MNSKIPYNDLQPYSTAPMLLYVQWKHPIPELFLFHQHLEGKDSKEKKLITQSHPRPTHPPSGKPNFGSGPRFSGRVGAGWNFRTKSQVDTRILHSAGNSHPGQPPRINIHPGMVDTWGGKKISRLGNLGGFRIERWYAGVVDLLLWFFGEVWWNNALGFCYWIWGDINNWKAWCKNKEFQIFHLKKIFLTVNNIVFRLVQEPGTNTT